MTDNEFLSSELLRSSIVQLVESPVFREAIAYLRRNAPHPTINDMPAEQWQQTRKDGIVAGYAQALMDLEGLPDVIGEALAVLSRTEEPRIALLNQHDDLPDYVGRE